MWLEKLVFALGNLLRWEYVCMNVGVGVRGGVESHSIVYGEMTDYFFFELCVCCGGGGAAWE